MKKGENAPQNMLANMMMLVNEAMSTLASTFGEMFSVEKSEMPHKTFTTIFNSHLMIQTI